MAALSRIRSHPMPARHSMKIPRPDHQLTEQPAVVDQFAGDEMADAVALLQHALDQQQAGAEQGSATAGLDIPPDDHSGVAGLVFQGEKDDPGSGAGALAPGHQPGDTDETTVAQAGQVPMAGTAAQ